jgi:hypothetical protein
MAAAVVVMVAYIAYWLLFSAWLLCFLPFNVPGVHC